MRWPGREEVLAAARAYARKLLEASPRVVRVGLFGSYARGAVGPGSDADLLVELDRSDERVERRALALPPPHLPVPVDLVVLTTEEIGRLLTESPRWSREVLAGALWLASRNDS